jgi:hypothetical protein
MKRDLTIGNKINDWIILSINNKDDKKSVKLKCKCGNEVEYNVRYINRSNFSKSCRSCSQIKRRNEDGKRIYNVGDILMNLEILKIHSGKYVSYTVRCNKCEHIYRTGHSILNKKSKGLGLSCCHNCFNVGMKSKKSLNMLTAHLSLMMYNKLYHQAELRGILFNVSPEYLELIFDGHCYFSGIELKIDTYSRKDGEYNKGNASLDRIDSNKGYVEGNVVWVYKPVNAMKNTFSSNEFINMCKLIVDYDKSKTFKYI